MDRYWKEVLQVSTYKNDIKERFTIFTILAFAEAIAYGQTSAVVPYFRLWGIFIKINLKDL